MGPAEAKGSAKKVIRPPAIRTPAMSAHQPMLKKFPSGLAKVEAFPELGPSKTKLAPALPVQVAHGLLPLLQQIAPVLTEKTTRAAT